MKTRIVKIDKRFYPEAKGVFGWGNFRESEVDDAGVHWFPVSFSSLDEAVKFLQPKPEPEVVWTSND